MKKLIALIAGAAMLLAMLPVTALSVGAADIEGIWTTYREVEVDEDADALAYKPEAGYEYTSEGFRVLSPDYAGRTPYMTVQTKKAQSIKDGVYLRFRVDDYSYDGGTGADHWICISLNSRENVRPGSVEHGGGWVNLIRGTGDGRATSQSFLTKPGTEEAGYGDSYFRHVGNTPVSVPMDDEGREIYTFEIKWNGSEYEMLLNGNAISGGDETTALLEAIDSNGNFYVGITMQSVVVDGTTALTILKYGTSEADATIPTGSDSKEPSENILIYTDPTAPSAVETEAEEPTADPTEVAIEAPPEEISGAATDAPAPADTSAEPSADTSADTSTSTDVSIDDVVDDISLEGCSAVVGMSAVAVLLPAAAAVVLKKKD